MEKKSKKTAGIIIFIIVLLIAILIGGWYYIILRKPNNTSLENIDQKVASKEESKTEKVSIEKSKEWFEEYLKTFTYLEGDKEDETKVTISDENIKKFICSYYILDGKGEKIDSDEEQADICYQVKSAEITDLASKYFGKTNYALPETNLDEINTTGFAIKNDGTNTKIYTSSFYIQFITEFAQALKYKVENVEYNENTITVTEMPSEEMLEFIKSFGTDGEGSYISKKTFVLKYNSGNYVVTSIQIEKTAI